MSARVGYEGFVAMRTPLLPIDAFLRWGEGCAEALGTGETGGAALESVRRRLRGRLLELVEQPAVREALYVASPDLEESLGVWIAEPESARGRKIESSLVRYFARMTSRATPFGMFAGCSVGELDERTRIELAPASSYRRRSRLDVEFVDSLCRAYATVPEVRERMRLCVNSSLYPIAGQVRYVEVRFQERGRSHHLVAVTRSRALDVVLDAAGDGATRSELAATLAATGVDPPRAREFVDRLVDGQLLVPRELSAIVTGEEPSDALLRALRALWPDGEWGALAAAASELAAIDTEPLGVPVARYRSLAARASELPVTAGSGRLLQVDLVKPAAALTIGRDVVDELIRGARACLAMRPRRDWLEAFRMAFLARYELQLVPLAEALDDELGVGLVPGSDTGDREPLVNGLRFPRGGEDEVAWGPPQRLLLDRLGRAVARGEQEIVLSLADVEALGGGEPVELSRATALFGAVAARSQAALDRGDFRVRLLSALGPSGTQFLGRFCYADPELRRRVEEHLRAEQRLQPDAVLAEIVHLPEGRHGNFICRPRLREWEIPYLGSSGAPPERQLALEDLLVGVRDDTVILWSRRLARRVIPRLTSAHNFERYGTPVYRFLCLLQGTAPMAQTGGFDWGPLADAPFLPRVRHGRCVLAAARWNLGEEELRGLAQTAAAARFPAVQRLRGQRGLPRLLTVSEFDHRLLTDLDNPLSVDAFVDLVKARERVLLEELWPAPEELCARGVEGRFVSELVVPLIRDQTVAVSGRADRRRLAAAPATARHVLHPGSRWLGVERHAGRHDGRVFVPGSEWLYAKLYTGTATADRVLAHVLGSIPHAELSDRWFFIRFDDPDHHLRLRFHGDPATLTTELWPAIDAACRPLLAQGLLRRVVLDTYERETERYGGPAAVELAERIFHVDSEAALELLGMLEPGHDGGRERWQIAACGARMLHSDLGLDDERSLALLERLRDSYGREHHADRALGRAIGRRLREHQAALELLLDPDAQGAGTGLEPGVRVLRERSRRLAPLVAELDALEARGELPVARPSLAASYVHMQMFRLLRSAHRRQELVIYDLLLRLSKSRLARARSASARSQPAVGER